MLLLLLLLGGLVFFLPLVVPRVHERAVFVGDVAVKRHGADGRLGKGDVLPNALRYDNPRLSLKRVLLAPHRVKHRVDADGDPLRYEVRVGPAGLSVDTTTGLLSWTPGSADVATHSVTVAVVDTAGGEATQSFSITVDRLVSVNEPRSVATAVQSSSSYPPPPAPNTRHLGIHPTQSRKGKLFCRINRYAL